MKVPTLTIACHEGRPPADDIFAYHCPARPRYRGPGPRRRAAADVAVRRPELRRDHRREITDARYPGERLVCCRNPALAAQRAAERESLLAATEEELGKIRASVQAGRLKDADKIGIKVGKVINQRKVGKHFITDIGDGRFGWRRDEEKIAAEAALDGIYIIRTSATAGNLATAETAEAYKDLGNLERDFWSMKAEDIDLRPIYHYLENRVRAHVLICMLATYLTWHLRQALAPLTFTDNTKPAREDPVIPARRSAAAAAKDAGKITRTSCPSAATTNWSPTWPHSLGTPSASPGNVWRNWQRRPPNSAASSNSSASPSRSASTERNHRSHERSRPTQTSTR
jgi:hypothetical protein